MAVKVSAVTVHPNNDISMFFTALYDKK